MESFVLRVKDQERRLYARRELYMGIRRDWQKGSRLFFVSKTNQDELIGAGILEEIVELDAMDAREKELCLQNNWYGRMVLERVERFLPPLPIVGTPLAGVRPVLLHGLEIAEGQAAEIDALVASRIVS
ncbi:MAG TPA: hypothetical protein VFZ05_04795 [Nitrososphaera sp.]